MGFWVNVDSAVSRIHNEDCELVNPVPKTEGAWHYAGSWSDVLRVLRNRSRWVLCKVCNPDTG